MHALYIFGVNVALDANILISDPWLRSPRMRALLDYVTKTRSFIVLHEVVEREVKANHKRTFAGAARQVQSVLKDVEKHRLVGIPGVDPERVSVDTFERWERHFHDVLGPNVVYRVPSSGDHHKEAVRRAIERVPPCTGKGEGIRDAIIWLDLLKECRYPSNLGSVAFVSGNFNDFAGPNKSALHPRLAQDVENYEAKITYYSSLERFFKDHVEPVGHITREWLKERLYFGAIEWQLHNEMAYGAYHSSFRATGSPYADYYVPTGRPDIKSVKAHLKDFYVYLFDDKHTEITLSVDAHVQADIERERVDAPPTSSYGDERYEEVSQYSPRTLPCYADLEIEMVADVEGDEISFRENEGGAFGL